jgi:hypothetical protein
MFGKLKEKLERLKSIDENILKTMKYGVSYSLIFCFIACIVLTVHIFTNSSYIVYDVGLKLFQAGLLFAVGFCICGISVDTLKKQLNP